MCIDIHINRNNIMTERDDDNEIIQQQLKDTHITDNHSNNNTTIDPNTLWISGFDEPITNRSANGIPTSLEQDEAMMKLIRQTMSLRVCEMPAMLEKLHRRIIKTWTKCKDEFLKFWSLMRIDSRVNYVMDVCPLLPYSDTDRYFILDRKKEYFFNGGETYDRKLLLVPYMNACTLASGPNDLVWLISEVVEWKLAEEAAELVQSFRVIYHTKTDKMGRKLIPRWPDKEVPLSALFVRKDVLEYEKQLKLKKGDTICVHNITESDDDVFQNDSNASFGIYKICNDPERTVKGGNLDGGTPIGDTGHRFNYWNFGAFCLPFENEQAVDAIFFVLLNVAQWLDEFRVEYLGRQGTSMKLLSSVIGLGKHICNNCGNDNPSLKKLQCAKCNLAYYCSRDCQVDDWKYGGHKKACKKFGN